MPTVSIITPAYNSARFLSLALQSAVDQTFSDLELLLIDDGSTDETPALGRQWESTHPGRIRYFRQSNMGLGAARNAALRVATGSYVALLDADDVWLPHRLEAGMAAFSRNPNAGLVHGRVTIVDDGGRVILTPDVDTRFVSGFIRDHLITRRAHISCPTVLFRRECLDTIGDFDTDPRIHGCEDRDLWIRIAARYEVAFVNDILAYYRRTPGSLSSKYEQMMRARRYVLDKHLGTRLRDRAMRRRALARISAEVADNHMEHGRRGPALRSWVRSLGYWPSPHVAGSLTKHALGLGTLLRRSQRR